MNLRESLLQSNKPKHQFHDYFSLKWIYNNKPVNLRYEYNLNSFFLNIIDSFSPWNIIKAEWFTSKLIKDGIHGWRHACRVAINSVLLALSTNKNISDLEIESLIYSALFHDCRRKNDNADIYHGKRAAIWIKQHRNVVPDRLNKYFSAINFSVLVHNDSYENIISMQDYTKYSQFVDILKTADALDRYRFPRSDWWVDDKYIVLKPSVYQKSFAFDLALNSEKIFLDTKSNKVSLLESWKKIKIRA